MAELADAVDLLQILTDHHHPKQTQQVQDDNNQQDEEDVNQLLAGSGLVLKNKGAVVQELDRETLRSLKEGLVGVIVTGSHHKSYCAGLGK